MLNNLAHNGPFHILHLLIVDTSTLGTSSCCLLLSEDPKISEVMSQYET
jgi:hypothetical protein